MVLNSPNSVEISFYCMHPGVYHVVYVCQRNKFQKNKPILLY
jgi:hypothetical protein